MSKHFHCINYSKSSTQALAKEAHYLNKLHERMMPLEQFFDSGKSQQFKELQDVASDTNSYLVGTQNEILVALFDRFVDEFGIRQYWKDNPDNDWLDDPHFTQWYEAIAKNEIASQTLQGIHNYVECWVDRIKKEADE